MEVVEMSVLPKSPKKHQFGKDGSGNPKGHPSQLYTPLKDDLLAILREEIPVTIDGKKILVTTQEALIRILLRRALKHDKKALEMLLKLIVQFDYKAVGYNEYVVRITSEGQKMIDQFREDAKTFMQSAK